MRNHWYIGLAIVLSVGLAGCGKSPPTSAGGKPVQYWLDASHSSDAKLRKKAIFKLGNVGPADARAAQALMKALGDADASVRAEAILALVKFGPAAREARTTLADMQQRDPDAGVRSYAAKAVEKLQ